MDAPAPSPVARQLAGDGLPPELADNPVAAEDIRLGWELLALVSEVQMPEVFRKESERARIADQLRDIGKTLLTRHGIR